MSKLFITSSQMHDDILTTCERFTELHPEVVKSPDDTLILGVARGGLLQAQYLSYFLNNRNLETISSRLYNDMEKHSSAHTVEGLENIELKRYRTVILCDDIYDSGETLEKITKIINEEAPKVNVLRLTTYAQKEATALIYGTKLNGEWVVFPWDDIGDIDE